MTTSAPPPQLQPMQTFDPSQPAILHDRRTDNIETWIGEEPDRANRTPLRGAGHRAKQRRICAQLSQHRLSTRTDLECLRLIQ
jgi:hypothetical protein